MTELSVTYFQEMDFCGHLSDIDIHGKLMLCSNRARICESMTDLGVLAF